MFVRIKTIPNSPRESVQIVQSIREGQKVRQKIVRHVGIAMNDDEVERLKALGEFIKTRMEAQGHAQTLLPKKALAQFVNVRQRQDSSPSPIHVDLMNMYETDYVVKGIHDVYGAIYKELELDRILPQSHYETLHATLFQYVMIRLAQLQKRSVSVRELATGFGVELPQERIDHLLEQIIDQQIADIQERAQKQVQYLPGDSRRILFFDSTSLSFESDQVDELRQADDSREDEGYRVQLALIATDYGLPVCYHVLPETSFKVNSLRSMIQVLR